MNKNYDISIVLGSKNRNKLLKATIDSIRNNNFNGNIEIIVVDGGSSDGSCDWLAKQKDIFTIIQPNYKIIDDEGVSILAHSWGEFMNIGFKYAKAKWIVMVSDDLILEKGCLQNAYDELNELTLKGEKIGGGAFFFKEFPRHPYYRTITLPQNYVNINHGFYNKEALEEINYIDEKNYNFYCGDGDLSMRLNRAGWKTITLNNSFALHLCHKPSFKKQKISKSTERDIKYFKTKYPEQDGSDIIINNNIINYKTILPFIKNGFSNVFFGLLLSLYDKKKNKNETKVH